MMFLLFKKNNEGPIRQLFTKLKKYNSQVNECGDSEIVKIIKNIRQHQEIKNSRKKCELLRSSIYRKRKF